MSFWPFFFLIINFGIKRKLKKKNTHKQKQYNEMSLLVENSGRDSGEYEVENDEERLDDVDRRLGDWAGGGSRGVAVQGGASGCEVGGGSGKEGLVFESSRDVAYDCAEVLVIFFQGPAEAREDPIAEVFVVEGDRIVWVPLNVFFLFFFFIKFLISVLFLIFF